MAILLNDKLILQKFNKTMMGLILCSTIFFSIVFMRSNASFKTSDYSLVQENAPVKIAAPLQDLATYINAVSSRELFHPFVSSKKKSIPVKTIDDLTKDMILVGVVSGDNKEAIIKNRRTRQTYFVSVGSRVGEIKVENISDDQIEVSYKQEQKVLFLR